MGVCVGVAGVSVVVAATLLLMVVGFLMVEPLMVVTYQ